MKGKCGRCGIAGHGGNFCRAVFDSNNVMIASHDDIVIRRVPVVIADSGAGPKRVVVTLDNTSGGYYPVLLDNQSQLSILHHTLLTNIFTTQHSNSGKRYCWSLGGAAS